jgi:hypothetical protein
MCNALLIIIIILVVLFFASEREMFAISCANCASMLSSSKSCGMVVPMSWRNDCADAKKLATKLEGSASWKSQCANYWGAPCYDTANKKLDDTMKKIQALRAKYILYVAAIRKGNVPESVPVKPFADQKEADKYIKQVNDMVTQATELYKQAAQLSKATVTAASTAATAAASTAQQAAASTGASTA